MAKAIVKEENLIKIPVYNLNGDKREIEVKEELVKPSVNNKMVSQVIRVLISREHESNAKVKGRADVRGGGRKPWRQKGTGRARQGSIRAPQWVGGGVVHGPTGSQRTLSIPKKWLRVVLMDILKRTIVEGEFALIENLDLESSKTKVFNTTLNKIVPDGRVLIVCKSGNTNLSKSTRNIQRVSLSNVETLGIMQILRSDKVLMEEEAFGKILTLGEGVSK